ncbi:MAG: hypothetical protein JKZ03_07310 [Flavobacteriaceae bacterium]|nr:hypothetical protein [Flavobacteriaceae bacterium]
MKKSFFIILALITLSCTNQTNTTSNNKTFNIENRQRLDLHDGYVLGNGNMYMVAGIGKELARIGKSQLTENKAGLTRIAWLIGPTYSVGSLGYGWEVIPIINKDTLSWETEEIVNPTTLNSFFGVRSKTETLNLKTKDILLSDESAFIREITLSKAENSNAETGQIHIPVYPDLRNGFYGMYNGKEVDEAMALRWRDKCGPNLKPRASVPEDKLLQVNQDNNSIILVGTNRALWQEISTTVPDDAIYSKLFPHRAAATTLVSNNESVNIKANNTGFSVDLGLMKPLETRTIYLYIVTEKNATSAIEKKTLKKLNDLKNQDLTALIDRSTQNRDAFLFSSQGRENDALTQSINATLNLCKACKANEGGIMAQPYMYPMYYVRDQFGSFKLFLAAGEYEKALEILNFYITKQNHDGIQNAHDLFDSPKDPSIWLSDANAKNGDHANAEVPSYIVLMAKEYYQATGDLEALKPYYKRLKYNINIQKPSINGVLPYGVDESYTNNPKTTPKFADEMTDSQLLFISATDFMKDLATRLEKKEDALEFETINKAPIDALFRRMWLLEEGYFRYTRDASDNFENTDNRPAFDALLRWFYLEMGKPLDEIPQSNLKIALNQLTNPLRVIPKVEWATGMDPGYLLYALSRSQHPLTHEAAQLLLSYASDRGLYSEYYEYSDTEIIPVGGTLRPWESAINAVALIQYLSGMRLDLPNNKINLQPHLPPGWDNWESKTIPLHEQGEFKMTLEKDGDEVTFTIHRKGGKSTLLLNIEFGLFGDQLIPISTPFKHKSKGVLFSETEIPTSKDGTETNFKFSIKND